MNNTLELLKEITIRKNNRNEYLEEISPLLIGLGAGGLAAAGVGVSAWRKYRKDLLLTQIQDINMRLQNCYAKFRNSPEACAPLEKQAEEISKKLARYSKFERIVGTAGALGAGLTAGATAANMYSNSVTPPTP